MALGQIEKNYGKGAIMRLGEDDRPKIAAIPTGALSLDVALGVGGLPRGRVTEIYGPESSGKCLVAGTYIWTDRGLETVEELFARVDQPASCASRVTDVAAYGVRLVNEEAGLEPMAAVTHNHRRTVRRVELESGRHVTATLGHPLRVRNERGRIVWRKVENLREGDALVSALFGADEAAGGDGDGLSEDEAVLLGYLVAERSLGPARPSGIGFTDAHDPDVLDEYTSLLESVLGLSADQVVTYADKDHRVHNAARRRPAEEYGLDHVESADKDIPHRVRCGGAKIQRAFLSALFEGDGWIQEGPEIGLTSASRTLVEQTQLLLYGLGIPASLRTRHHDELDRDHHALRISAGAVSRFLELVGFRSERRARQVATHLRDVESTTRAEHPPHLRGPLVDQLHELARPLTFERITAIVEEDPQPTFDVVVPGTHSFLANGMLSHNTTVALHCIAEAQMAGGIAAFIDAEHALDPTYAAALGVDTDALLVSQPDTGEQALEITDMLVRSGAVDIVVIDSVAALTPRAEIEGEMGDSHVGLQARLMSQALRKLAGNLNRSRTSAVFINQLREKIGVMFGCFSYRSRVVLADGTTEKIGKIVNQRMPVKVRTYDPETDSIVNRRVTNWFDNGRTERFLQFTVAKPSGNGRSQFQVTPNHLIRTPGGWREAGELIEGDRVLQSVTKRLSDFQWEVLLGGLMGDGALSPSRSGHAARFRFGHGAAQASYAGWKAGLFENVGVSVSANAKRAMFADVRPLPELAELRRAVYLGGRKFFSEDYVKALTPLSLAVWYMDDGGFVIRSAGKQARTEGGSGRITICVEAMEASTRERLRRHLADTYGITSALSVVADKARLTFSRAATDRFQELVAPFIHPSMEHKLLPRLRGRFAVEPTTVEPEDVIMPLPITEIRWSEPAGRSTHRFDIEVEGTHNYFVDGVMAHNSPETTPGGRALKFYSSVRLDVRRIESLKDGTDAVGNRVRVKVVKNKCAPPFRQAEFDIMYGLGISKEGSLLDMGVEHGIVKKAGAWYTYDGEQLGQGRENARTFLKEHTDLAEEIRKKITELLGLSPVDVTGDDALAAEIDDE
ncbi:MAG: intein-containing recombinase RecA [Euzebyales bacterium]|nr:intein-containing recombinase RecA [Euzebyales bacterium]